MGRKQFIKAILFLLGFVPLFVTGQNYPRFELYQLKQGTDSGQFIVTGLDSNLAFNNILRFRSADSTFLIGTDTVITNQSIIPILLQTIDAGLGIEVNQVNGQIFIESLSIEDSITNQTGTLIEKGTPLYATGVQGNYWTVAPADASDTSKMPVVVIAGEDIANGATGLGLIKGHIKQVNTTGLASGSQVYVGATGGYTSTKPTAEGVIIQRLGTVIKGNSTNGSGIINLGDEAYWNDFTSLSKLRDTLVLVRGSITTEIGDSLTNYASRTELQDTALAIRTDIPTYISDSLINYVSRIELGDTATNIRTTITSELSDSLTNYPNRTELADTALAIRNTIPIQISDSLTNYASRTELQDTASAIRADFPAAGGDVTTAQLADTASAIRSDIPSLPLTLGTQTDGNYVATATTSGDGISGSASGEGSTFTVTSNATNNNTANTIVYRDGSGNFSAGTITASLSGNSSTATKLATSRTISLTSDVTGSASFDGSADASITATVVDDSHNHIISNVDFLSDSLSALRTAINAAGGGGLWSNAATAGEIYYNGGNVAIGNTDPNYPLHVTGRIYSSDDILVDDELIFGTDGTGVFPYIDNVVGKMLISNYLTTSSTLFDFYDKYNTVSPLLINTSTSTYQIEANGAFDIDGNLTQTGTIVQDGGTVTFNNTQSASYDFGVGSLNYLPFMWVDASADKMAVGGGTPAYTLDVTGDINFTGDLYDDGVLFSGGGVTINNNTDNYLLTASGTANTINGESGLTWDGSSFDADGLIKILYNSAFGGGYYLRNTSTGLTSGNGVSMSLDATDFYLTNYENADVIIRTDNNASKAITLKSSGIVQLNWYGTGTLSTDASGNISASDGRFKTVTRNLESGLEKVMKLNPLYYRWNEDSGFNTEFEELGFIAQDVKKIIPEAAPNKEEENKKLNYSDRAIIATLTKAIQEQQEMIEKIQTDLEVKNVQIELQDQRIQQLEQMVKKLIENK